MKLHQNTEFYIDMVQFTADEMGIKAIYLFDSLKPCDGRRYFFVQKDMNLKNRCVSAINFQAFYWEVCYAFGGLNNIVKFVYVLYLFLRIILKKWIKTNII
jgi:hypothetical protein